MFAATAPPLVAYTSGFPRNAAGLELDATNGLFPSMTSVQIFSDTYKCDRFRTQIFSYKYL